MDDYGQMTLVEHLTELRRRIIISLIAIIGFSIIGYAFAEQLIEVLTVPIGELVFLSPIEAFYTHIRVAIYAGFIMALPIVVYQAWRFILPALNRDERKLLYVLVPLSLVLFFSAWPSAFMSLSHSEYGFSWVFPDQACGQCSALITTSSLW